VNLVPKIQTEKYHDKTISHIMKESSILIIIISCTLLGCSTNNNWRSASRASAGIAPDPSSNKEAVIHIYGADAWGWRGWFAIHTWVAAKRSGEAEYTVYDVVGWRNHSGQPVVAAQRDIPDRYWYGSKPVLLKEHRGIGVEEMIDKIEKAVEDYPWKDEYHAFPGPNSNTFVAWIGKRVPELELELPFSAIGSGYVEQYRSDEN
jgi:hypothetical protein